MAHGRAHGLAIPRIRGFTGVAVRVALTYLALGLAWIFGSDIYLYYSGGPEAETPTAQLVKGSAFVAVSSIVVFLLVRRFGLRVEAERRRRKGAERGYRALVASTPDAILLLDRKTGVVLDANDAAERLFGYSRQELLGLKKQDTLLDTEDPASREYLFRRKRYYSARSEVTMIRATGERFPAEMSGAVFRDVAGNFRVSAVIRDISDRVAKESALRASEARLSELTSQQKAILDSVFARIALIDTEGGVRFANSHWSTAATTAGLPQLSADVGTNYLSNCREYRGTDETAARRIAVSLEEVLKGEKPRAEFEFTHLANGRPRWNRIAVTPYSAEGLDGAVVATLDVTDQRRAESRMRLVDAAFRSTDEAILICDESFLILEVNDAYLRMTGLERQEALESKPTFLEIGDQARAIGQALATDGHWHGELLQQRVNGETFISSGTVNVVEHADSADERLVITFTDISAQRYAEQRAEYLTFHDPVTNLPNRRALEQWFETNVRRDGAMASAALIYLDLDRFKTVNESFGHDTGDELLRVISRRLQDSISTREAVARLGGDEFLVIADEQEGDERAVRRAKELLRTVSKPWRSRAREVFVSASAGISFYPRDGRSFEKLLREAEAALNQVKIEKRRGGVSVFRAAMKKSVDDQMLIERGLHFAVERGELELEYQPIVTLQDGIICGAEALVRWNSPDLGRVGPDRFIPIAEETGLITDIGHWVLEQACTAASHWRNLSTRLRHLSVNISALQFRRDLAEDVEMVLRHHQVPGSMLRFEITESVMMFEPKWTLEVLGGLHALGVEIAIDDFGTGYSSLAYLRDFPVECLKLDREFIRRLPDSAHDAHIMHATIDLAHRLGIHVVAEGLENEEQLAQLTEWGCDEGQGFYIARPMTARAMDSMLRKGDITLVALNDAPGSGRRKG